MTEVTDALFCYIVAHKVSLVFIVIHMVVSGLLIREVSVRSRIGEMILELFGSRELTMAVFHVLFIFLFSGIEVCVSSFGYGMWMISSAFLLFVFRFSVSIFMPTVRWQGPSFCVLCQMWTFFGIHRPVLYFKVSRFQFSDTFLYSIGVLHYLLNDPLVLGLDLVACLIANLIWKLIGFVQDCYSNQNNVHEEDIQV
jgi:hypothetical protein